VASIAIVMPHCFFSHKTGNKNWGFKIGKKMTNAIDEIEREKCIRVGFV
jgi:hypothetical protein